MDHDRIARMRLAEVLDLRAAKPLAEALHAVRGNELTLEAQGVRRLGGLCLQVLLSADLTWARDGVRMCIEMPSPAFRDATRLAGALSLAERFAETE